MRVPFELRQQFLPYLEKMIHKLNLFLEIGSLFQSLSLNSCFDFLPYTLLLIPYCYWQEILSTLLSSAWGPGTGQCCSLVTITCPTGSIFECFWFLDSEPQILEAYFYFTLSFWRQSSLPLIFFFHFELKTVFMGPIPLCLPAFSYYRNILKSQPLSTWCSTLPELLSVLSHFLTYIIVRWHG